MESYRDGESPPRHSHSHGRSRSPRRRRSARKRRRIRSRSRSRSRSRTRSRSRSRSRHRSGALLSSAPFTVRPTSGRPPADWVCGVCSNPNSARREDCFRCGTAFAASVAATPSEEVRVSGLPPGTAFSAIREALAAHFAARGEACGPVAYSMGATDAFVRFASVAEATRALTYARSALFLDGQRCAMSFSALRRATTPVDGPTTTTAAAAAAAAAADAAEANVISRVVGLPEELQRGVWRPVEAFQSEAEHKAHLDALSRHWELITQEQKEYYDEHVRRALAAQRRTQQEQQQQQQQQEKEQQQQQQQEEQSAQAKTGHSEHSGGDSSIDSIRRRLAEKRQAVHSAQEPPPPPSTPPPPPVQSSTAASLRERLATMRAHLMTAKTAAPALEAAAAGAIPKEATTAAIATATTATATATATTGGGTGAGGGGGVLNAVPAPAPMHLFFGFPIPSRFPATSDYLVNSKSPSLRAGVLLRYVSPAVAERIISPSLGPPEAKGRALTR